MSIYERTELLLGKGSAQLLWSKNVMVFGAGGVGSYVLEALARAGIGKITVCDSDEVSESNINRQLIATQKNIGTDKVEAVKKRIEEINPDIEVTMLKKFLTADNIDEFSLEKYDYIVDAIDTVGAKIALAVFSDRQGIPLISSMGTGNKLCPEKFEVGDIYKTSVCPLARVMRRELKIRGVKRLKVVWSKEEPVQNAQRTVGSVPFVPGAAGLIIAGEVIKDLIK